MFMYNILYMFIYNFTNDQVIKNKPNYKEYLYEENIKSLLKDLKEKHALYLE